VTRSVHHEAKSSAWHSSGVCGTGDNPTATGIAHMRWSGRACLLPQSRPLRSAHLQLKLTRAQFRANRHRASASLRADLIEDEVKPGEEENNKVRRWELLSFFTG
jgi:hypothetical protein